MSRGWRIAGLGGAVAVVGGVGGYGMYQRRLRENRAVSPAEFHAAQGDRLNAIWGASEKAFRQQAEAGLELFRFLTCPYCGTVKAFLDYYSIPHKVVEVDPMLKTQIKPHGYGRVPQLKFSDGVILVDSDEITNLIASKVGAKGSPEVDRWRLWARNQLSRYIVLVLNRTVMDSVRAYDHIDTVPDVPLWSKWMLKAIGGPVMYLVAEHKTKKTLKAEYGFGAEQPEEVLRNEMDKWIASFPSKQKFHGGKVPDMADLDVYGVLLSARPLPLWEHLKAQTKAREWVENMEAVLAQNRRELP